MSETVRRRYAAVDPGTVRVGLAVADEDNVFALARGSVSGQGKPEEVARRVGEALADVAPTHIVVGLPLSLDGSEGTSARRAKVLARAIRDTLGVKVALADERLTTAQATRGLRELGVRGKEARQAVDAAAAAVLLQSVLDRRKSRSWRPENEHRPSAKHESERLEPKRVPKSTETSETNENDD